MILGITGTIGAGKGTVVDYLVQEKGFKHYSVRAAITEEVQKRGLPVNRDTLNQVGTELRKQYGGSYFGELLRARAQAEGAENAIIESVRTVLEATKIKSIGGCILVVDAPEEVRYERIQSRASETDHVSFEEFRTQEAREMDSENANDPSYMNMRAVIAMADVTVQNDGTLDELHTRIEEALAKLTA